MGGGSDSINTPEYVARGEYVLAREQRRKSRALDAVRSGKWPPKRHPEDDEIDAERRQVWKHVLFQAELPEEIEIEIENENEGGVEMAVEDKVFVSRAEVENERLRVENARLTSLLETASKERRAAEETLMRREVEWRFQQDASRRELSERSAGWAALDAFRQKTENAELARLRGEHDGFKEAFGSQSAVLAEKCQELGQVRRELAAVIGEKERLQGELEKSEAAGKATLNTLYEARCQIRLLSGATEALEKAEAECDELKSKLAKMNREKRQLRDAKRKERDAKCKKDAGAVEVAPQAEGDLGELALPAEGEVIVAQGVVLSPVDVEAALAGMPEFGAATEVNE